MMAPGDRRQGIGVSPGVAIGPALVLERRRAAVTEKTLPTSQAIDELTRLADAVSRARAELELLKQRADAALGPGVAQIFDAQMLLLEDTMFLGEIESRVRTQQQNAEWAVRQVGRNLSNRLSSISDVYLRERGTDVDDLTERLLRALLGEEGHRLDQLSEPIVLFAHDLTPSETALLDPSMVLGFATDVGSRTSHTAIVARSLGIPAVVGLHDITSALQSGERVAIDGDAGVVVLRPEESELRRYREGDALRVRQAAGYFAQREQPAVTRDGFRVTILANIEGAGDAAAVAANGGEGVGLFRSEYLYLRNPGVLPTEEEHYTEYRAVLQALGDKPVAIRTLDIGGEKLLPGDPGGAPSAEGLLGLRALRLALREREVFGTQLRGLLRASVHGRLQIMLPFVSGLEELREARALIDETRDRLVGDGYPVADEIPVGAMLEVPAAALAVDLLAAEVDFFAIGSNDLIQYLLAVDRANDSVAHLYEPLHPAVLRILRHIVETARAKNIPVSMCGEMAAEPLSALILLGFGIDQLSMIPSAIPLIKNVVRKLDRTEARELLDRAFELGTAAEIEALALPRLLAAFPDLASG
ncbi:MAG: phosphoenolpyruvate--protein phosphotransferase [Acidobacteriota bacterium]|jgi:phosphotransferase system enzyme I (PtsI)